MNNIKYYRLNKKLSQKQLADIIKCKQNTISDYENEKSDPPIETLKLLAYVLEVSIDELLDYDSIDFKNKL